MVFNTRIDGGQLLALINDDFGLETKGKDKVQLLGDLNDFLLAENTAGRHPIVIIDEAQNLSEDALEEIRLLSNLEADAFKLIQIVLVGQPELRQIIARVSLRQLRQRINISCHLGALNQDEMVEYIFHRLETAGNRHCVKFQDGVFDAIFKFSSGIPRLVNLICDFLLLSAFVEETLEISMDLVDEAVRELTFKSDGLAPDGEASHGAAMPVKGGFEARIADIEDNYAKLSARRAETEAIVERMSSQGSILEYLINQQQKQFGQFDQQLKRISAQLDRLRQALLSEGKQARQQEVIKLENLSRKESL